VDARAQAAWALLADPQRWPQWYAAWQWVHSPAPGPLPAGWRLTTAQQAGLIPAATGGGGGGRPAPPARRSDTAPEGCAVTAHSANAEAGGEDPPRQEGLPCWSR